jgi:uridine nucleosidase
MIPLNVTHTAIVTKQVHSQLLSPDNSSESYSDVLPEPSSELRRTLSTVISFFAGAYKTVFGFDQGPPLHDALTIAYVCHPLLFSCQRYRVDVEIHGVLTSGETVVDKRYCSSDDSWGPNGKNINNRILFRSHFYEQVSDFFGFFLECVEKCDNVSPLNKSS